MSSSRAFTPIGALVGVAGWTITYAAVNMTAERYSNVVVRLPWGEQVPAVPPAASPARATPAESSRREASATASASLSASGTAASESGGRESRDAAGLATLPQGGAPRARAWQHVAGCVGASALFGRSLSQAGGTVRGLGLGVALGLLSAPVYVYTHVTKGEPTLLQHLQGYLERQAGAQSTTGQHPLGVEMTLEPSPETPGTTPAALPSTFEGLPPAPPMDAGSKPSP